MNPIDYLALSGEALVRPRRALGEYRNEAASSEPRRLLASDGGNEGARWSQFRFSRWRDQSRWQGGLLPGVALEFSGAAEIDVLSWGAVVGAARWRGDRAGMGLVSGGAGLECARWASGKTDAAARWGHEKRRGWAQPDSGPAMQREEG